MHLSWSTFAGLHCCAGFLTLEPARLIAQLPDCQAKSCHAKLKDYCSDDVMSWLKCIGWGRSWSGHTILHGTRYSMLTMSYVLKQDSPHICMYTSTVVSCVERHSKPAVVWQQYCAHADASVLQSDMLLVQEVKLKSCNKVSILCVFISHVAILGPIPTVLQICVEDLHQAYGSFTVQDEHGVCFDVRGTINLTKEIVSKRVFVSVSEVRPALCFWKELWLIQVRALKDQTAGI